MTKAEKIILLLLAAGISLGLWHFVNAFSSEQPMTSCLSGEGKMNKKILRNDRDWKEILSPERYQVMRKGGTEKPWSGIYNNFWEEGTYVCAACDSALFLSASKYDHGTGWPSFSGEIDTNNLKLSQDNRFFMNRIEVKCANCDSHLGHLFFDGPEPGGKHYCINSLALKFLPAENSGHSGEAKKGKDKNKQMEKAIFAAGCFWGVEAKFSRIPGVIDTEAGYSGGQTENPTYEEVCTGKTGHAESVLVTFDPGKVTYEELVRKFFSFHDPTQLNRQGPDKGTQYRSAIFYYDRTQLEIANKVMAELRASGKYKKTIKTELVPVKNFFRAEEYHQKYYEKHGIVCY